MKIRVFSIVVMTCCFVAVLSAFPASSVYAESSDCNELVDKGERLKCKHGNMLYEQKRVIENLELHFGEVVPAEDFERLRKAHIRAKKTKDRTTAKNFKSLGKKKPSTCDYAELLDDGKGDDDGICEPGERCKELIGDGLGDETQPCKLKGKNREVCEEICEGSVDEMESDIDEAYLDDLEENYDDVTKQLKDANDTMENNGEMFAAVVNAVLTSYPPHASCQPSPDWLAYGEVLSMTILKQISVGLRGIADIAERGCDQTGAGFNCATCCVVLEGAASVAAVTVETVDGIHKLIRWGVDSTTQSCLSAVSADLQETKAKLTAVTASASSNGNQLADVVQDINTVKNDVVTLQTSVNELNTQVGNIQQQLNALSESMQNGFNILNTMVSTPQGQRPGFPNK
jgi:hypothetical protein